MSSVDDDQVAWLTRRGWTLTRIAKELGCSTRTVGRARERTGVAGPPGRPLTDADLAWAERLLEDGCSVIEVERTLGRSPGSLAHRFRGRGWTHQQLSSWGGFLSRQSRAAQ